MHFRELHRLRKDEQTKLSGNDAAHQAIDTAKTKAEEIATAIESIGTNLQSVSTGFTAVDEATLCEHSIA